MDRPTVGAMHCNPLRGAMEVAVDAATLEWCQRLPKVELHAHLNGSISEATIKQLVQLKQSVLSKEFVQKTCTIAENDTRTMSECFELFPILHRLVDDRESLALVTRAVIRDFAADGVKYLELRSTPRDVPETGLTKQQYVETVLQGMRDCEAELGIVSRLLLSVDRKRDLAQAMGTLRLAARMRGQGVVGLDLSGDPNCGQAEELVPLLARARQAGLKLALHIGEVRGREADDNLLLSTLPDRIGHATFVNFSLPDHFHIPIETCLTSNVKCRTVPTYRDHHMKAIMDRGRPFVICTDDKGVFCTTLSREYALAAQAFGLSKEALWDAALAGVGYGFCDADCRAAVTASFLAAKTALFSAWV